MKGMETPEFKLKWKLLHYHLYCLDQEEEFDQYRNIPDEWVVCKSLKQLKEIIAQYGADIKILSPEAVTEQSESTS